MMATMATETRDDLSRLVRERRAELGLSLVRVVEACQDPGLSKSWLNRLELAQVRDIPQRERLTALARGLQLPFRLLAAAAAAQYLGLVTVEHEAGDRRAIADRLPEFTDAELVQVRAIIDAFARNRPGAMPDAED